MSNENKPIIGKTVKIIIIAFFVLIVGFFLVDFLILNGSYILNNNPLMDLYIKLDEGPLIEDVNGKKLRINQTVTIANIEYNINSLDIGDNYSALYFDVDGISNANPIGGVKLYQNGQLLPYVTASTSSYAGSAIGFAPADGYENLELHFDVIESLEKTQKTYPLTFDANKAIVDVEIADVNGQITLVLTDEGHSFILENLESLEVQKEFGNRNPIIFTLLKNGELLKDATSQNRPTDIIIVHKTCVYAGDTVIVPVS